MKHRKSSRSGKNKFNRSILRICYAAVGLFFALIIYLVWFVQFEAPNVIGSSYNPRANLMSDRVVRGEIRSADGEVLAKTQVGEDGTETRVYPFGSLFAPVTGYVQKGRTGVESLANFYLLSSHINALQQAGNELVGVKNPGDDLVLTVDSALQKTASDALGDRRGAVIAMDYETGRILCMVSKPTFDPNTIGADWEAITAEDNDKGQLLNRAAQGAYPPGSTFKLVTLLAYVRAHPAAYEDFSFDCTGVYTDSEGNEIRCYGNTAHGHQNLKQAFANSCNGAFAKLGETLPAADMNAIAKELLFNESLPFQLPYLKSSFRLSEEDTAFMKGQTAIGQGRTTISPLHNLLIASAVANGGRLMEPMLLDRIVTAGGQEIRTFREKEWGGLLKEEDAALLAEYMRAVVTDGTGSAFRDAAYETHAKTGSAEYEDGGERKTHALCIAYAEYGGRRIAVSVIVEDGKSGGSTAAPVARAVMDGWLLR